MAAVIDNIALGTTPLSALMIGEMGIKQVMLGETELYTRPGGFFYLELDTKGEMNNG